MSTTQKRFLFLFLFFVNHTLYAQTAVPGDNFGYTAGSFGVSAAGAATYNIPFVIPPGTAGLQPSIGISYSSQSGNSFVGLGWNLSGLSTITRSSKTRAQDETADAIQQTKAVSTGISFDNSDRFSLDGERLVLAPESIDLNLPFDDNYGEDQTVYYTEQNSFSRVTLHGDASTASTEYFEVYTKSGLIFEYGNTTDSRITDPTKLVAYQWLVNKISDRNGNYMTFSYDKNLSTGEVYPDEIEYTGNAAGGLTPYNKIQFVYENRPDVSKVYGIRYQIANTYTKRLKSVKALYDNQLVREYKLSYTSTTSSQIYSLLSQIQECDGSGSQVCLEPTVFEWSNLETGLQPKIEVTSVPTADVTKRLFGDFNGDGLNDIMVWSRTNTNLTMTFYSNDGDGNFVGADTTTENIGVSYDPRISIGEFNGDNVNDILVNWIASSGTANNSLKLISVPDTIVEGQPYNYRTQYYSKFSRIGDSPHDDFLVDLNQDGLSDLVDFETQTGGNHVPIFKAARLAKTLPENNASAQVYYDAVDLTALNASGYNSGWSSSDTAQIQFNDFNNDGLTDIFLLDKVNGHYVFITPESQNTLSENATRKNQFQARIKTSERSLINSADLAGVDNTTSLTDMNADGLADVLILKPNTNTVTIIPNKGYESFELSSGYINLTFSAIGQLPEIFPNDFNADGLIDLTFYSKTTGANKTYLNKGNFVFNNASITDAFPAFQFKESASNLPKPIYGNFLKGSHLDLLYYDNVASKWYVQQLRQFQGYTIKKVTNGAGLSNEITYDNLLQEELYEKAGQVTFPNVDIQAPLYIVSKSKTISNTGEETAQKYRYCGATINVEGRGFRGFTMIMETDTVTGIYDRRFYRQGDDQWKYTGNTVIKTERYTSNDVLLARTSHHPALISYPNNAYAKSYHSYAAVDSTEDFVNNTNQISRIVNDTYGNPLSVVVEAGEGFKDSTANEYTDNYSTWLLGRLTKATVTHEAPDVPIETRQATFEYNSISGQLTKETSDANLPTIDQVEKTYIYDAFGNITSSTTSADNGTGQENRTVLTTYDAPTKRFITQSTNPLGHIASTTYDQRFGVPLTETDINGLVSTYEYDGFSRFVKNIMPDGTWQAISYRKANSTHFSSPTNAVFLTYTQSSAGQTGIEHYDSYNRAVQTKSKGFDGRWVIVDHLFNRTTSPDFRETIRDTYPYYEGETPGGYTQREIDKLGRIVEQKVTKTGGVRSATNEYGGLLQSTNNFHSQNRTERSDKAGRVVEATYNSGNNLYFKYDAGGRLLTTTDLKGNVITNTYNARGLKISMNDPDMGLYQYAYNGFGELLKQTYPNGDEVSMTYDKLGRLLTRTDPDGTTTNTYDVGNKAKGSLSSVNAYVSSHSFTFDNLSRKTQETLTIDSESYNTNYTYDSQGRIATISYPASGLVLKHVYNSYGFLSELRNNAGNALFWKVDSMDASGNVTLQSFGNGVKTRQQYEAATLYLKSIHSFKNTETLQHFSYAFNDLSHVTQRKDEKRGNTESFNYDDYNRLVETQLNGSTTTTLQYDILGNITYKSDVGHYEYGGVNDGPHRLLNVRTNNADVVCSFTLDINTTYTSFNKVKTISNDTATVSVFYGPDQQRIKQEMRINGTLTRTKYYLGLAEKEVFNTGKEILTSYIGGTGTQVKETQSASTTTKINYYLRDHLGSVTGLVDEVGALAAEFSFDAWGLRRNADWTKADNTLTNDERGFTGHEHYDLFSIIDMNGRVYDAVLGRFLQPDPFVQDVYDLQSYNRYAYVLNNPLSYSDPSGFFFKKLFRGVGKAFKSAVKFVKENWKPLLAAAVGIGVAIFAGPAIAAYFGGGGTGAFFSGAAAGFAASATGTLLNKGSISDAIKAGFKGAVIGGITAGLTNGIGDLAAKPFGEYFNGDISLKQTLIDHYGIKTIGHGLVQGTMSEIQGGSFVHGLITGAISGGSDYFLDNISTLEFRVATSAILGGVSSELSGGQFVNGAITGAFVRMYNSEAHESLGAKLEKMATAIGYGAIPQELTTAIYETFEKTNINDKFPRTMRLGVIKSFSVTSILLGGASAISHALVGNKVEAWNNYLKLSFTSLSAGVCGVGAGAAAGAVSFGTAAPIAAFGAGTACGIGAGVIYENHFEKNIKSYLGN